MDTIHDLGGKRGFGPIDVDAGDRDFRFDWERRIWAIAFSGIMPADGTIPWFRHAEERMVPADYLAYSYFQKWVTFILAVLIDDGRYTLAEALTGETDQVDDPPAPLTVAQTLALNRASVQRFDRPTSAPPAFAPGDAVRAVRIGAAGHTRLPAYARGARGRVVAHHGAQEFADASARGVSRGEHLYTVSFAAPELWGGGDARDEVRLDLWESYLEAG